MDNFLLVYDFNEVHAITVRASPACVFRAIKELTPAELSPIVHWLVTLRALPARLLGKRRLGLDATKPIVDQVLRVSFILLADEPDREIVLGTIGQFWRATAGGERKPAKNAEEFIAFERLGFAKAVMNFRIAEESDHHIVVTTETRIHSFSARTRAKFAMYWRLIYPGSALIRVMWLKAIKRRAESTFER